MNSSEEVNPDVFQVDDEKRAEIERAAADDLERQRQEAAATAAGNEQSWNEIMERAARETGMSIEEMRAAGAREIAAIDEQRAVRSERLMLQRARVGNKHIRHVGDRAPIECQALTGVREFVDDDALWCLILSGGNGTRKTGSACWALTRIPGIFVEAHELLDIAFGKKREYEGLHERLLKSKLVVFDDLGTERADDGGNWAHEFQYMWNRLYENDAKLIVTCNMPPVDVRDPSGTVKRKGFASLYDKRVIDRFREGGRWINLQGESVRPAMREAALGQVTKALADGAVVAVVVAGPAAWFASHGALALASPAAAMIDDELASRRKARQVVQLAAINGLLRRKGPRSAR